MIRPPQRSTLFPYTPLSRSVSGFRCHGQSRNRPPATIDVEQSGRRRRVGVPQIVMDSLEVPLVRAGLDIDGGSEEHTSELQSRLHLVCRLLLEKKKKNQQLI